MSSNFLFILLIFLITSINNRNFLFPLNDEDLFLQKKITLEVINDILMKRINAKVQEKSVDLKKESKLTAALAKILLCKNLFLHKITNITVFFKLSTKDFP